MSRRRSRHVLATTLVAAAMICSCDTSTPDKRRQTSSDTTINSGKASAFGCTFPNDYHASVARSYVKGFEFKIKRSGEVTWNGSPVERKTLAQFAEEVSSKPLGSSTITIRAEPGSACSAVNEVRGVLRDSGVCERQRCIE